MNSIGKDRLSKTTRRLAAMLPAASAKKTHSLGNGEYPDHTTLRYVLLPPYQLTHEPLLESRVDAVAGLHRDVLYAVNLEGRRRRDDARVGTEVPKLLAGAGIIGAELA